ncbi:hypothetical protein ACGFX4_27135 [Kitasatospora sp. NPDC048365]|uniref:hypothetical protein n=1 Tax=Kitasatospora sp. NPDC048365 TaxID=3364050 RepID=UPI0037195386
MVTEDSSQSGSTEPASLDWVLPKSWSEEQEKALDAWKQGDLLPGGSMVWAAPAGADPITNFHTEDSGAASAWEFAAPEELTFPWVIITSQTCDIAGVGPGARHSFVQVSPVVALNGVAADKLMEIKTHQVQHYVYLTAPPESGHWAVDLRISLPVSKQLLIDGTPKPGFAVEADALDFAEHVAHRIRRPALHDAITTNMTKAIGAHIKQVRKNEPDWWQKVEQIRILMDPERLRPRSVRLVIIQLETLTKDEKRVWNDWRTSFAKTLRKEHGIQLQQITFTNLDSMKARLYAATIPLRIPELQRAPIW